MVSKNNLPESKFKEGQVIWSKDPNLRYHGHKILMFKIGVIKWSVKHFQWIYYSSKMYPNNPILECHAATYPIVKVPKPRTKQTDAIAFSKQML